MGALGVELQVDAAVDDALALQALADAGLDQHVARALLEHARPHPRLAVLTVVRLYDHRLDSGALEQPPERQAGRARADDRHLRAVRAHRALQPPVGGMSVIVAGVRVSST